MRWLFGFVRPRGGALLALLALSVTTSLLVLVQPYLTKLLIDDGLVARRFDTVLLLVGLIFCVGLVATLLSGANRYFYTRLSGHILFDLRESVYRHLQTLGEFDTKTSSWVHTPSELRRLGGARVWA